MGADVLLKYFALFNLGQKTGIDIPGEVPGFIPSREWKKTNRNEQWFVGDTYNISIGQGDTSVTPLQVASWTSTIINGGKIVEPHIVRGIVDPLTKKETKKEARIIKEKFIDQNNLDIVKQGMRDCVLIGSCKLLQNLPFPTGGKTGTAQWNKNYDPHAWFTAFAPYNNPQIVVTVLVEEGKEGAGSAMPIAYDFLAWWGGKYLTQ
jgi:penicillin-binding protein 2